ncbi:hypothetical protein ABKA04_006406 [Annulohypoxylon sp. FPYF3050]
MKVLAAALLLLPWGIHGRISPYVLNNTVVAWDANADGKICTPDITFCEAKMTYALDTKHCFINTGGIIFPVENGDYDCSNCQDGDQWATFQCDCKIFDNGSRKSIGFLDQRASALSPITFQFDNVTKAMVPGCFKYNAKLVSVQQ